MRKFTTRVELHSAQSTDYDELHEAMKTKGFSRFIKRGGVKYHLPEAEYNCSGEITKTQVLELAKSAADSVGKSSSIVVTESKGSREIHGLKKAR